MADDKGKPKTGGGGAGGGGGGRWPLDLWLELLIFGIFILTFGGVFLPYLKDLYAYYQDKILSILSILRPIFYVLDAIFFALFLLALVSAWPLYQRFPIFFKKAAKIKSKKDPNIVKQWTRIMDKAKTQTIESLRLAIIEADALVDTVLKKSGYEGEHMADRLSGISPEEIKSLDKVWRAHRLRNDIVHTTGFAVGKDAANEALSSFEIFLKEIGAL